MGLENLTIRITSTCAAQLDRLAQALSAPGTNASRGVAVRAALTRGLLQYEAEGVLAVMPVSMNATIPPQAASSDGLKGEDEGSQVPEQAPPRGFPAPQITLPPIAPEFGLVPFGLGPIDADFHPKPARPPPPAGPLQARATLEEQVLASHVAEVEEVIVKERSPTDEVPPALRLGVRRATKKAGKKTAKKQAKRGQR